MKRAATIAFAFLASGCFGPSFGEQPFACGPDNACPPGYECNLENDLCMRPPFSDGGVPDAYVCTAKEFRRCLDADTAVYCGEAGAAEVEVECPGGCDESMRRCYACSPNASICATDDLLVSCGDQGQIVDTTPCPGYCTEAGGAPAHCAVIEPSLLPAATCDSSSARILRISTSGTVSTDGCTDLGGTVVPQNGPVPAAVTLPDLCVIRLERLVIDPGVRYRFIGQLALVVVADDVVLGGVLDVGGLGSSEDGAGSIGDQGRGGVDDEEPIDGNANWNGGGGGGHFTAGGNGTTWDKSFVGGGGSFGYVNLQPLIAGARGGRHGLRCVDFCTEPRETGGGGGGAVELVACHSLTVLMGGGINAGGGGGEGGDGSGELRDATGGGGGGSGGAILVEAPRVSLPAAATLTANGGGGGGGGESALLGLGAAGAPGEDGQRSAIRAQGGRGAADGCGDGGAGGIGDEVPDRPGNATPPEKQPGAGGGGAAGRIRVNTPVGRPLVFDPAAVISPAASAGVAGSH